MHYRIITWCIHVDVYAVIHITLHVFRSLKEPHNLHFITSIHNGIQMCVVERQINDFEPGVQLCYTSAMLSPWTALFKTFCLYHPQRTRAPGWSHCRCHRRRFKSDYMQPPPKPQKILILFITFFFFFAVVIPQTPLTAQMWSDPAATGGGKKKVCVLSRAGE